MSSLEWITIKGFKSIVSLEKFKVNQLNILIGANGVGKSNFLSFFELLDKIVTQNLQVWVKKLGGSERLLSYGIKNTNEIEIQFHFGKNKYHAALEPTIDGGLVFSKEILYFDGPKYGVTEPDLGNGHLESRLNDEKDTRAIASYIVRAISKWKIYHFDDTTDTAGVKRSCSIHDNAYLRPDASNLPAFLYRLSSEHPESYYEIRKTVQLAIPFFDDFIFKPDVLPNEEKKIRLLWKQKNNDYPFWPSQLSDGSLRFICLATALLQPNPPSLIIIDEPELGLHPYAISLLGAMLRSASNKSQIIVSTQSVTLINEFNIEDLIVVERDNGNSRFQRYSSDKFKEWLDNYSLGELWEKNILKGCNE
ncbi:hypothetical protein Lrub_0688 [Legionella rubrilucens]|uniref:ATPase AAA-type core domain-containing protein n=1 Tax=Legionella rubrilucens TaxID=458 RepID=A0A0W0XYD6_9GAMM|nr:AAA family ATPase [Legionella rubrilucens]KTD49589.1 hypothetical protein Lrub_0688 [Legionella rubrilucens]